MRNYATCEDQPLFDICTSEHTYQSSKYDFDDEEMKQELARSIGKASVALHKSGITPNNDYRDLTLYEELCFDGVIK